MDKETQDLYVRELKHQADLAISAAHSIDACIATIRDESIQWKDKSHLVFSTFREIHSLLTHASNISKLFWPVVSDTPPNAKKPDKLAKWHRTTNRGAFLRTLYDLRSGSILENRDLRNHLEHFDERLDDFSIERDASTIGKGYVDMYIGDLSGIVGPRPDFILRHYHQGTGAFTFRGELYDLTAIHTAVTDCTTPQKLDSLAGHVK